MDMNGKVAVVTGGASGIGQAVARRLAEAGGKIAIFDLNEDAGQAMVAELGVDNCVFANVNVVDEASVKAGIEATVTALGAIHVNVNCAGIGNAAKTLGKNGPFPLDLWNTVIAVNLTGTFNVLRLCAEVMAKNEPMTDDGARGVIINTASVAAYEGQMGQAAYSASKGGIVGMTLPIARDLSTIGIRVNTIVPGLINTPLFNGLTPEFVESLSQSVLYPKRLGRPEEIAQLAAAIIDNDYINGECIRMDGGIRMQPR
ncbi:SDR family oxidoreductase [Luminiphilus sp.]|jgi:NAD(P)-dependent dehydrogenase (short-subunit alcohol dehydrogenase family)|nr:SDR family oxidoreductase [Luminiphilus sp.]MBT6352759.1 SDR family oxidoreductase [Halieaceae bacterium]MCH1580731.1 SDR family oxidoreductase [Luminiphilus sp.]MDA8555181.1 SDR family oxidoreductase [Luminiphilus sp.]MDC6472020.1 SDR family oxidoreductase [Luminiphilus sp.]